MRGHPDVIPGRSEAKGKGIQSHELDLEIPFPAALRPPGMTFRHLFFSMFQKAGAGAVRMPETLSVVPIGT